jgi:DNA-binding LacI/PurR family transcriptional regulator
MITATIKDVAKRAGVSTATVSRVLNDSGYFDAETARLVNEAVEALGYRRNIHWKRLAQNASETVCFLLGNRESLNSMQVKLLLSCERVLAEAGYDLVFSLYRYDKEKLAGKLQLPRLVAQQGSVDGVILAGVHHENFLEVLERMKLPYVMLGNTYIGHKEKLKKDAVVYDDVAGCFDAIEYLLRLGHRRIAFAGNIALPWFGRRYQGYGQALKKAGLPEITVTESWNVPYIEYGKLAATELLRRATPPTAIFSGNDEIAGGVWKTLTGRGIAIPREISLIGFGDREELSILEPSLTTVSVFQEKIGEELARMLVQKIRKPGLRLDARSFPCQLLERSSCSVPLPSLKLVKK